MNEKFTEELIGGEVANDLSPEEKAALERLLAEDPEAKKLHAEFTAMKDQLETTLRAERPTPNFEEQMVAKFRKAAAEEHPSILRRILRAFRLPSVYIPATAVLFVGLVQMGALLTETGNQEAFPNSEATAVPMPSVVTAQIEAAKKSSSTLHPPPIATSAARAKYEEPGPNLDQAKSEPEIAQLTFLAGQTLQKDRSENATGTPVDQETGAPADNRKLVRNATLDLEVERFDQAVESIAAIASANSGFVATKNSTRQPNGKISGTVVIKVLPAQLDAALAQIGALGVLRNQNLSTQDITRQYFDTEARLRNARKMEERLLELLGTMKGKVSELLEVEKELARVREEIEKMQGEVKVFDSLMQYATITIALSEKDMNEAAAYLLRENITMSLFAQSVEKAYESARQLANSEKVQVLQSRLIRENSGRITAQLTLLASPEEVDGVVENIRALGRIQNFNKQDERIARDGSQNSANAKTDKESTRIELSIVPDDEARKQVGLVIATKDIEGAFEQAKKSAASHGGEVLDSRLVQSEGGSTGSLTVRVPAGSYEKLLAYFRSLGVGVSFGVDRDEEGEATKGAPVIIRLDLRSSEDPVQFTQASLITSNPEEKLNMIKYFSSTYGAEIRSSAYERTADGKQIAMLVVRLPLKNYQRLISRLESLGTVENIAVRRQDKTREGSDDSASMAEVSLRVQSVADVIAKDNGFAATLRKTLGQGVAAFMWSVRMIGVAIAFIAPWAAIASLGIWISVRMLRRNR